MKKKIKKRVISTVLSTLIISSAFAVNTSLVSAKDSTEESKYLVLTESKTALDRAEELSSGTKDVFSADDTTVTKMTLSENDVNTLKNTDGVVAIEKDIKVLGASTDDVDVTEYLFKDVDTDDLNLWYLDSVGSADVDNSDKVKIELLDSGVNYSGDIDVKERIDLTEENVNPLYEDYSGHGTSMASVIAAKDNGVNVTGINPNAELYSVKVLGDDIQSPISRIIEGIEWGIDNDMDIINMSFGTNTNSAILREVITKAYDAGILLVAATGNNSDDTVQYPAAYPEVLAVGSMDENSEISDFTSVGDEMDVIAPGEKIETIGIFGTINGTSGTSISTAEVTAVASKILEKDNEKSPDFVKDLIVASAKKVTDKGVQTGAVDCEYALEIYDDFESNYSEKSNISEYSNPDKTETYDTDGFVTGLWSGSVHAELAGNAASDWLELTSNQLKLIKAGAKAADYDTIDGYDGFRDANGFHGTGNYVANLRCALKFVNVINNTKNIDTAYSKAQALAESLPAYESSSNAEILDDLLVRFWCLDVIDFSTEFDLTDNLTATSVKYKALGLCLHMVADIYAHRVRVPKTYADSNFSDTTAKKYFSSLSSFSATTQAEKQALVDAAQNNTVPSKYRYLQPLTTSISYGVVETRDIKRYCSAWYNNSSCGVNGEYEDNVNFYKRRYEEADYACYGITSSIDANGNYLLDYWDLIPTVNDNGTSIKLASFKSYVAAAGYDTSELSDSDWNLCTMYPMKVDSSGNIVKK